MAVMWDKAAYDAAYSYRHPQLGRLHFDRRWLWPRAEKRAQALIGILGLSAAHRVLIVGCGFGWTVEALAALGIDAVGTDVSPWIQAEKGASEATMTAATVLDEDSLNAASRDAVKEAFAAKQVPTHVVTEDLLESFDDAELGTVLAALDGYGGVVAHLVTPLYGPQQTNEHPEMTWRTMADWRTKLDALGGAGHALIQTGLFRVF